MKLFPYGHATHPQWQFAAALVLAQLRAQMAQPSYASSPTLAILYITDHYSSQAQDILDFLSAELPEVTDWSGTVGVGIASNNVEYFDEPALCVMLCDVPADQYRVFSGVAPLAALEDPTDELLQELPPPAFQAHTALIHADSSMPDAAEMIAELSDRTRTGYLFGGFAASRSQSVQFAVGGNGNINGQGAASGVFAGGLSGVAFSDEVLLLSRVSQGCQPLTANGSKTRKITACDGNLVTELDGEPALDVLLHDLNVSLEQPQEALEAVRATLVGISNDNQNVSHPGIFGSDVRVRHIIGLDPAKRGVAIAEAVQTGMNLAFCQRNVAAARSDLVRICAEIREELESQSQPEEIAWGDNAGLAELADRSFQYGQADNGGLPPKRIAGAIYVSCSGRGGPHFGGPSAELQIVRKALGDVPLVGFFAGGEIARHHVYGYTGVLTVFMAD
ncbi:MAG: FIST C-terminal domain-containing protein [Burkholderiaceae bacterium]